MIACNLTRDHQCSLLALNIHQLPYRRTQQDTPKR